MGRRRSGYRSPGRLSADWLGRPCTIEVSGAFLDSRLLYDTSRGGLHMRLTRRGAIGAILATAASGAAVAQEKGAPKNGPAGPGLTLSSPDFQDGGIIPNKYT